MATVAGRHLLRLVILGFVSAVLSLLLTGCDALGISLVEPIITEPISQNPTPLVSEDTEAEIENFEPGDGNTVIESPLQYPQDSEFFECVEPIPAVMTFLGTFTRNRVSAWRPEDVVMVRVGPGNNPIEEWWIVAVANISPDSGNRQDMAFLTNAPSAEQPSGELFIRVDQFDTLHHFDTSTRVPWGQVRWSPERIEFGQLAEAYAYTCLPE